MNRPALFAAAALVAATVSACGGGSGGTDAPTNASAEDFCAAYVSVFKGGMTSITGKDIKAWGEKLEKTGTPKELTDDQRSGFEVFVDFAKDVDTDAKIDDIADPKVSDKEQKQVDAFIAYTAESCTDEMTKVLTPDASS